MVPRGCVTFLQGKSVEKAIWTAHHWRLCRCNTKRKVMSLMDLISPYIEVGRAGRSSQGHPGDQTRSELVLPHE
jgi:hypothetical protein